MPTAIEAYEFLLCVLRVLAFVVSGGVLMGIIDTIEHYRGKNVSWRFYAMAMGLSLLLGIFVEWRIGYSEKRNLESKIDTLNVANANLNSTKISLEKMIEALRTQNESLQRDKEKLKGAIPKPHDLSKLCFNQKLPFEQVRLEKLPANTPPSYDYVKEVTMPEFSTSGNTRLRIHHTGNVGWVDVTPKDDGTKVLVVGGSYVELSLSPNVVHSRHWYVTLFGVAPFDVICIDRLPIRPRQD